MSFNPMDHIRIDRRSSTSISEQIASEIRLIVIARKMFHHDCLPTISVLARHLGVTEIDVSSAYQRLLDQLYIDQTQDGEYRVAFFEISGDLGQPFYIIVDKIIALGMKLSIRCVEKSEFVCSNAMTYTLGFAAGERLLLFKRVYFGDHRPFFIGEHIVPLSIFPMFKTLNGDERLYPLMQTMEGVHMAKSKRYVEAVTLDDMDAAFLSVRPGTASVQVESKSYDPLGRQIEFSKILMTGNYSLHFTTFFSGSASSTLSSKNQSKL